MGDEVGAMKMWQDMTPRERDIAVAERVMMRAPRPGFSTDPWTDEEWAQVTHVYVPAPRYTTNSTACRLVEEEIERRRLQAAYTLALMDVLGYDGQQIHQPSAKEMWELITATPEQRCHAAWLAVEESSHA
jgi:hypothetical protein